MTKDNIGQIQSILIAKGAVIQIHCKNWKDAEQLKAKILDWHKKDLQKIKHKHQWHYWGLNDHNRTCIICRKEEIEN